MTVDAGRTLVLAPERLGRTRFDQLEEVVQIQDKAGLPISLVDGDVDDCAPSGAQAPHVGRYFEADDGGPEAESAVEICGVLLWLLLEGVDMVRELQHACEQSLLA